MVMTSAPRGRAQPVGPVADGGRQGDPHRFVAGGHEVQEDHERLVIGEDATGAVHQCQVLAPGVDHRAQICPGPTDRLDDSGRARHAIDRNHSRRLRVGIDAQHVRLDLGQEVGHDEAGGAVGQVQHQLEVAPGGVGQIEGLDHISGVVLQGAWGEVDVADVAGGDPAELLAVVETLDPPLLALGEIEAVGVEEADGHRLRVVGAQANRQAALRAPGADVVPGHREWWPPRGR